MTGLTTLFAVGPEEYVEFHESLGSKVFLEHVWDQSTTPLSQQDTAASRLHSAGARLTSSPPPDRIEFPTVKRTKGKGNTWTPTGKWISWQDLKAKNPLAVSDPPNIDEYRERGAMVGQGEKLAAGAWLKEKRVVAGGSGEKDKDVGRVAKSGKGSGASIYAPKPNAEEKSESTSVAAQRPGAQGSTSTTDTEAPTATASAASAPTTSAAPAASTPAVKASEDGWFSAATPSSPARTPQTPARKRGVPGSPAPARTPLSESAPLPETPLKHDRRREQGRSGRGAAVAGAGGTASLRQTIADRRNVPFGHAFTTPDREWSQQPSAGVATPPANPANAPRGLGLGLTPTKATPSSSSTSSSQFGGPLPSPSLSKITAGEMVSQAPSSPKPAAAADQIESMLLRLRGAKSKTGSSASRWATSDDVQQAQQQPERSSGLDQATESAAQTLNDPPQLRSPPPPSPRPEQEAFPPHVPQQQEEPGSPSMASLTSSTEPPPLRQEFLAPSSATHRSKTMRRTSSARSDTTVKAGDDEGQSESFDGSVDAGETVEASESVDTGEIVDADESLATSETTAADDSLANISTESVIDSANQSQHFDWADDDELEDSLPDLDDWGITVPESPAASPEKLPAVSSAASPALSSSSSTSPSKSRSRPPAKPRRDLFAQAMQEGRVPTGPKSQRDNRARPVDGDWKAARAATFAAEQAAEQKRTAKSGGGKSRDGAHAARESPAPRSGAASSADDRVGLRIAGTAAKNQGKELLPSSPRQRGGGGGDKKGKSGQSGRKKAESGPRA
ncbi:unnamed protein product [Jaminaea pallidilutea]